MHDAHGTVRTDGPTDHGDNAQRARRPVGGSVGPLDGDSDGRVGRPLVAEVIRCGAGSDLELT